MANYVPTKCVFRSCKKEFFEQWQKDKELIDDDLYNYLSNTSPELFNEYQIEDSSFTYESDSELPTESIITTYENYSEAELWISGAWYPAPEVAFCLAELLAQKAGIDTIDVQIIFTINFAEHPDYVLTTDAAVKDKLLISLSYADSHLFDEINNFDDYSIKNFYDLNHFLEPSEMLRKIKKIIKDNNLQGYDNLGKDFKYKYTSTQKKYLGNEPSDVLRALFDFQSRYNGFKQIIRFDFLIYCHDIPTKYPDLYTTSALKFGSAESYFHLGQRLYNGEDIEENKEKAEQMFCKAAENGYDKYEIAEFYYDAEDEEKIIKWCELSAQEGNPKAQYLLGVCYYWGNFIEENEEKAIEYYKLSSAQGYPDAQIELGMCYLLGIVVEKDENKALHLVTEALDNGYDSVSFYYKIWYNEKNSINEIIREYEFLAKLDYQDSVIAELFYNAACNLNERDAAICYTYALKYGHPEAQKKLNELKKKQK